MAPRPYWKGYLKLSLVSCPVALYPASSRTERISFHWLNRETGNRLRQQMVDSETGDPVEREERVRGYQLAKHDYLMIEDEEIDAVEIESSHTIEIERFVPRGEIDAIFLENSHYLAPDGKVAEEAFAVIREAMAEEDVVGIGRAVLARRERLLVLQPRGKGILATVLHYNYEVRDDRAYFEDIAEIKIPGEMLDLAKHIIRSKMGHFNIAEFEDRYENALIEMIRAKQAGRPVVAQKPIQPGKVINLMEALRKSIAAEQAVGPQSGKVKEHARAAASSRREPKRAAPKATKQSGQSAKPAAKKPAARK
jgi:DNA end-binding protein Ku